MRFSSQVRVAPMSGHVIGFDLGAMLPAAAALGYDLVGLAELLPAVEWGMVTGLAKRSGGASDGES